MNKKGFTLIELLAVIVVLAIIALIATPIVMNTIADAQEGANERSVEGYMKAWEAKYYAEWLEEGSEPIFASIVVTTDDYNGADVDCTVTAIKPITATCTVGEGPDNEYNYLDGAATKKNTNS